MTEPFFNGDAWWAQQHDGTWLRWNADEEQWESSSEAPVPSFSGPAMGYGSAPPGPSGVYATPAPQPYGYQDPYAYQPPMPPAQAPINNWAVASLVLGLLWLCWVGSALAIVFGILGRREIVRSRGAERGLGLATAGIVLGCVGLGFLLLGILGSLFDSPS